MTNRPTFAEIITALQARPEDVARCYAPGGGPVTAGRYWALNPGRPGDKHIGSFYVSVTGQYAGRWYEASHGVGGDMLDLIELALNCDRKEALAEAKRFLGMVDETYEQRKIRLRQEASAKRQQQIDAEADEARRAKRGREAQGIFLHAHERLADTPVAEYLANRAIGLPRLGRIPHTLRYHPKLHYYHMDKKTGEVIEGDHPAMVAAIYSGWADDGSKPEFIGVHKTYLQQDEAGRWIKLRVPKPKLLWGSKKGGYIRIWTGKGPRGGKGAPLNKAAPGSRLYISEGIEDALSMAVLNPAVRVAAAIDLGNIQYMRLPPNISEVVIIADNDPDPVQMRPINNAVAAFSGQGRHVSLWRNEYGGKDLNDALMAARENEDASE